MSSMPPLLAVLEIARRRKSKKTPKESTASARSPTVPSVSDLVSHQSHTDRRQSHPNTPPPPRDYPSQSTVQPKQNKILSIDTVVITSQDDRRASWKTETFNQGLAVGSTCSSSSSKSSSSPGFFSRWLYSRDSEAAKDESSDSNPAMSKNKLGSPSLDMPRAKSVERVELEDEIATLSQTSNPPHAQSVNRPAIQRATNENLLGRLEISREQSCVKKTVKSKPAKWAQYM